MFSQKFLKKGAGGCLASNLETDAKQGAYCSISVYMHAAGTAASRKVEKLAQSNGSEAQAVLKQGPNTKPTTCTLGSFFS